MEVSISTAYTSAGLTTNDSRETDALVVQSGRGLLRSHPISATKHDTSSMRAVMSIHTDGLPSA